MPRSSVLCFAFALSLSTTVFAQAKETSFVPYIKLNVPMDETVNRMRELSGAMPRAIPTGEHSKLYLIAAEFNDRYQIKLSATVKDGKTCSVTMRRRLLGEEQRSAVMVGLEQHGVPSMLTTERNADGEVIIDMYWRGTPMKAFEQIYSIKSDEVFMELRSSLPDC